jgi:hypothetical protein
MPRPYGAVIRFVVSVLFGVSALHATRRGSRNVGEPGRHIAALENHLAVVVVIDEDRPTAGVVKQMVGLARTGLANVAA